MAEYIRTADVAKHIRKLLKQRWPGRKFYVRSNVYSLGSSIRVSFDGAFVGPTKAEVEALVKPLEGGSFDGMQDLMSYHNFVIDGTEYHGGADFIFVNDHLPFDVRVKRGS